MQGEETFEITKTANAAELTLPSLKNWLRQGVIKYCGEEPRASRPRVFPRAGVYEIALVRELVEGGFDRAFASKLVQQEIDKWRRLAGGEDLGPILAKAWKTEQKVFEKYRDVNKPCIWVFAAESSSGEPLPAGPHYAMGYEDVPAKIAQLQKVGKPYLLASVPRGSGPNPAKPGAPFHVIGTLNVTAILSRVDGRLKSE